MSKEPEVNERIVSDGRIIESFRRFVAQLSGVISGALVVTPSFERFDTLVSAQGRYKNPYDSQVVIINNVICHYDKVSGIWRKADGTAV